MPFEPLRPPPESLSDGVIELRRYRASFADALYAAVDETRAELGQWMFWAKPDFSLEDARESAAQMEHAWDDLSLVSYAVFDANDGRFLGGVGFNNLHPIHRFANLGYWVRASAAGRGIAARATRLISRVGFEDLGLIRLEIVVAVENARSRRVAEKTGAELEGVLRKRLLGRDRPHDAYGFSLIAEPTG